MIDNVKVEDSEDNTVSPARTYLESLLNKSMKIQISDGRTLIGQFLCTDRDKNIILGSCQEYIGDPDDKNVEEPRLLGLAMVPGRHVLSMHVDVINEGEFVSYVNEENSQEEKEEVDE